MVVEKAVEKAGVMAAALVLRLAAQWVASRAV